MGLISKTVIVKWNSKNRKWYENKGYKFTNYNDEFEAKIEDLTNTSNILVKVQCDYCSEFKYISWSNYKRYVHEDEKYYCRTCAIKIKSSKPSKQKIKKSFYDWCLDNNRQDILDRWDYELNKCRPGEIMYRTTKRYYFKCPRNIHPSELKSIYDLIKYYQKTLQCKQCSSFAQWCYDNLSKKQVDEIMTKWDYELNKCSPFDIGYTSNGFNKKGYWFKCLEHPEHKSELKNIRLFIEIYLRYGHSNVLDCVMCNSFAQFLIDTYGKNTLILYWDYEKNKNINPFKISKSCSLKIWIKCQEKSYHGSYNTRCNDFYNGSRCPYCNSKKIYLLDSLGKLLDNNNLLWIWSDKNKKSPNEYSSHSDKKVWWKCFDGKHKDYKRDIHSSNTCGFRCPECVRERDESFLQEKVRLYLENVNNNNYTILHERKCTIIPRNPKSKTNNTLPFDNEVKELKLIIEVMGIQHYKITSWHKSLAKKNNTTPEYELHYQKLRDRYKKFIAYKKGYNYIAIPYWTDDKEETWKQLINDKIKEISI